MNIFDIFCLKVLQMIYDEILSERSAEILFERLADGILLKRFADGILSERFADEMKTLHSTSMGVDIFFSEILSYLQVVSFQCFAAICKFI